MLGHLSALHSTLLVVSVSDRTLACFRRVNPVERIFAAFPTYLYLNASLGGALLAPLLEAQAGQSELSYAAQDIGETRPVSVSLHV